MISSVSCVRFVPRTNQKDYVKIWQIKDGQCTSYVNTQLITYMFKLVN